MSIRCDRPSLKLCLSALLLTLAALPAAAQTTSSEPKWDIDVHVGSLRSPKTITG